MSFCTLFPEKYHSYPNRERGHNNNMSRLAPFLVTCLATATIFSLFLLYSPNPFLISPKQGLNDLNSVQNQTSIHAAQEDHQAPDRTNIKLLPPPKKEEEYHFLKSLNFLLDFVEKEEECDLFTGHWIPDTRGAMYTNSSCATIPESKNCFRNGRRDRDFLNWRWKPDKCELPRFDPKTFLEIVRGKKMAFIGDSVARNHIESLLCLLSQEENPKDIYKYSDDRFRIWYFPQYDFTLMKLWSKHLIAAEERMVNGSRSGTFDLQLDKVDDKWAEQLPELDYAIFSAGHWFFRLMYLHEGDKLTGCVYCNEPNVTEYNNSQALRMAFRAIFKYIKDCKNCKGGLLTLLRTFAPAHFEGGAWNTGGYCNRTSPLSEGEIDLGRFDWELRSIQVEEFERARKEGEMEGRRFRVLDITRAMLMRPDGHPGAHWGNKWMKGYNDCVHWCMPGPVDYWNHFLMEIIRNEGGLVS